MGLLDKLFPKKKKEGIKEEDFSKIYPIDLLAKYKDRQIYVEFLDKRSPELAFLIMPPYKTRDSFHIGQDVTSYHSIRWPELKRIRAKDKDGQIIYEKK